jgi:hypothetical protein
MGEFLMEIKIKNEDDLNNYETTHSKRLHKLAYEELEKHTINKINTRVEKLDTLYIDIYKNEMLNDLRHILNTKPDEKKFNSMITNIKNEIEIKSLLIGLENIKKDIKLKWDIETLLKSNKTSTHTTMSSEIIDYYRNIGK